MFTGIIETIGAVDTFNPSTRKLYLKINFTNIDKYPLKIGDSVAVDGVCLTLIEVEQSSQKNVKVYCFDVGEDTFKKTSIKNLSVGKKVNIERAMMASSRFDGHIVTGHVDTIGKVSEINQKNNTVYFSVKLSADFSPFIAAQGSICLAGVSLTVSNIIDKRSGGGDIVLTVGLVPHTAKESSTTLENYKVGDDINVEVDILSRYVQRHLTAAALYGSKNQAADSRASSMSLKGLSDKGY